MKSRELGIMDRLGTAVERTSNRNLERLYTRLTNTPADLRDCEAMVPIHPVAVADLLDEAENLRFWEVCILGYFTQSLPRADLARLKWLTTNVLHLPATHQFAVAEALWEQNWKKAQDPFSYIRSAARRIQKSSAAPRAVSVELIQCTRGLPDLPDPDSLLQSRDIEILYDLERAISALRLSDDVFQLIRARYDCVPDSKAAADFGWTAQQLDKTQKRVSRILKQLRDALRAYASLGPSVIQYLPVAEAAELSALSPEALAALIRCGALPSSGRGPFCLVHPNEAKKWTTLDRASHYVDLPVNILSSCIHHRVLRGVKYNQQDTSYCIRITDLKALPEKRITLCKAASVCSLPKGLILRCIRNHNVIVVTVGSPQARNVYLSVKELRSLL
jgi:hypothetical protein